MLVTTSKVCADGSRPFPSEHTEVKTKGVLEHEFRTWGRGGTCARGWKFIFDMQILAQIGQIKTIQNPLELENV
jgi:hypothetical protein